jgi:hypothetical protein
MSGSTKTFTASLTDRVKITQLYPEEGTVTSCIGTTNGEPSTYATTTTSWNVHEGDEITDVPYTVQCTISYNVLGVEPGQPNDLGMWFYPRVMFEYLDKCQIIIASATGGHAEIVSGESLGDEYYRKGSTLTVKAIPDAGYYFTGWSFSSEETGLQGGAPLHSGNPISFTVTKNDILYSHFEEAGTSIPQPQAPSDLWAVLTNIWSKICEWFKTVFGLQTTTFNIETGKSLSTFKLEIVSGGTVYPKDTFQYTFTLENTKAVTIPDSDYTDGTSSFSYAVWMVTDSSNNIIYKGEVKNVILSANESTNIAVTWNIPGNIQTGKYAVSALLIEIPMHWDRTQAKWIQDEPTIIDKQAVELNVQTITPPTAPNVWERLQQAWQNFINWLRNLFRWV